MTIFELKINKGFYFRFFKLILTYSKSNHNFGFFKLGEKSFGFVLYKVHNKFKWNRRNYNHKAIQENIEEGYSMGNWILTN